MQNCIACKEVKHLQHLLAWNLTLETGEYHTISPILNINVLA